MVVGLHGRMFHETAPELSNLLENYVFRLAVPVFFIINGYFLFQSLQRGKEMKAWCMRMLALYISWTVVYGYFILQLPPISIAKSVVLGYNHLWYLQATLTGGIIVYILRNASTRTLILLFLGCYLLGTIFQYLGNYHVLPPELDRIMNQKLLYRNFLLFGMPMIGMGFLMAREGLSTRLARMFVWRIAAAGIGTVLAEYALNRSLGQFDGFDMLFSLPIACAGVFLVALDNKHQPLAIDLAGMAALVYFAHPLFLYVLPKLLPVQSSAVTVIAAFTVSTLIYPLVALVNRRWAVLL